MYVYQVTQVVNLRSRRILAPIGASDRRCVYITKCYTRRCRMLYIMLQSTARVVTILHYTGMSAILLQYRVWAGLGRHNILR
jgi:hypothetical protein